MKKNFRYAILILLFFSFIMTLGFGIGDIYNVLNQLNSPSDLIKATPETKIFIYKEHIIFKLFCSVIILSLGFFLYFYGKKETTTETEQEDTSSKKDASVKKDLEKKDSEKFHFWPWIRTPNGMFFLISFAIFVLIFLVIIRGSCCGLGCNESQLIAVTLSVTLATIIPSIISKIIAKDEIESIIDKRLKKHITDIKKNHDTTLKETAHSSRMISTILYLMGEPQKQEADTLMENAEILEQNAKELEQNAEEPEQNAEVLKQNAEKLKQNAEKLKREAKELYKKALKNIGWSIGWGTKAISQYLLIKETYPQGINKFSKEILTDYISKSKKFIDECNQKLTNLGEKEKPIRPSDLKSIFQVHALIKIHDVFKEDIELKDTKEKICVKNMLEEFERLLTKILGPENITKARECRMTELDDDLNEELEKAADEIIQKIKNEFN